MIFAAIFALVVGAGMIAQWSMSYLTGQIPELRSEPIRIGFHLAAEMTTALCLIASGLGIIFKQDWGIPLFIVADGMLFYTSIVSPGYFAQKGQWAWLGMFSIIIILGIISLFLIL
jgi:hypothetical protein